jgi:hypothetical protein
VGVQGGITGIIDLLKLIPGGVLPADHIGQSIPAKKQDLPAMVVSSGAIKESPIGVGGMISIQRNSEDRWIEKRGTRISGSLCIDIWATDEAGVMDVAKAMFQFLEASKNQIRDMGFLRFAEQSIGPVETTTLSSQNGQNAAKLAAVYSIAYEDIKTIELDEGGVIREVHIVLT